MGCSNKIVAGSFPKLRKITVMQTQETHRTSIRQDQKRKSPQYILVKTISISDKVYLKLKEETQITYKEKPIRIIAGF